MMYFEGCEEGCASVLYRNGQEQVSIMSHASDSNRIQTHYLALKMGLEGAIQRNIRMICARCESIDFMTRLLNHEWDNQLDSLLSQFDHVRFEYAFRHENQRAKRLALLASQGI